ncbi:formate/nitrite transporter family protein [Jatrophihabitans sp.]|uniref:formate/nitrite transporter family protein n=1 Tax=Jatrophihabitans sp. TaxID=1932789 RepID=UPI002C005F43|nr:formate/nitrite transporter family protein [Jatrophihabitans sp.]
MAHDLGEHRSTTPAARTAPATGSTSGVDSPPTSTAAYNTPQQIAVAAVASGTTKALLRPGNALVGGFLAGAYIAFGGLLAIVVSAGLNPQQWGGLITLFTGLVFSLGLILVIVGGAELLTGNMALVPIAVLARRVTVAQMLMNWLWVTIGNLVGSVFVAYVLADKTGVIAKTGGVTATQSYARLGAIAMGKAASETHLEQFLRAVGCNWLVCLAIWLALAARDVAGKILAIIYPITAFVALGFDHVVANMFFLPAAMFLHTGGVTASNMVLNLIFAFLGNAVGAALFVAGAYWYLYLRDQPAD